MEKIIEVLKNIIIEVTKMETEELYVDTNLFSLGLDSLMLIQIKKKIDNYYHINLPVAELMNEVDTIEKIAGYIMENLSESNNYADTDSNSNKEIIINEVNTKNILPDNGGSPKVPMRGTGEEVKNYNVAARNDFNNISEFAGYQFKTIADTLVEASARQLTILKESYKPDYASHTINSDTIKPTVKAEVDFITPKINFRAVKLDNDIFTDEQKEFIGNFITRYNRKTINSKEYAQKNRLHFSDWIASLNFRMNFKELIYPIVSDHSQGAYFWDIDGNKYLDMAIGYGAHFFGHRPEFIIEAVRNQLNEGYETGPQTDLGGQISEALHEITGVERVAFANTGSEAVMAAMRIARTVTKKNKVVFFKGSYHGNFDSVLAETEDNITFPISPGTMAGMVEDVIVLEYATDKSIVKIREMRDEIAAVMVEPVQSRNPSLQPEEYLKKLRTLTQEIGAALIFDEMITGFRICPGGVQEHFGIKADIVTYGKIIGGGFPIGIVAGKAEYIDAVDGGFWNYGDNSYPSKEMTYFAGTFCKHPISMAASNAVLQFFKQDKGDVQKKTNQLTKYFVEKVNDYFTSENVPIRVSYFASEFKFETFGKFNALTLPAEMDLFFYLLMEKGIYIWEKRTCFFSAAHTYEDADYFLKSIKECVDELQENGFSLSEKGKKKNKLAKDELQGFVFEALDSQKRFFVLSQLADMEKGVHLSSAWLFRGKFDTEKIKPIFKKIIYRHTSLRTGFVIENNVIRQRLFENVDFDITVEKITKESLGDTINNFIRPFNIFSAPLIHVQIAELEKDEHVLLIDLCHAMFDGYSASIIAQEFINLYNNDELSETTVQFNDYITYYNKYLVSESYNKQKEYWLSLKKLKNVLVELPLDYPRPHINKMEGAVLHKKISGEETLDIKKAARKYESSLYMLLFAGFQILLSKLTGEKDIIVGTPVDVRPEGFENVLGLFTNTLIIYNDINPNETLSSFLSRFKKNFAQYYSNFEFPFEHLVNESNVITPSNRNPIFDIMFIYENAEARVFRLSEAECEHINIDTTISPFDLSFEIVEEVGELIINITYNKGLFKEETIKKWLLYYETLLKEIQNSTTCVIADLLADKNEELKLSIASSDKLKISNADEEMINEENSNDNQSEYLEDGADKIAVRLQEMFEDNFNIKSPNKEKNFFEMGLRSINALQLVSKLQKHYEINILDIFKNPSINKLSSFIYRKMNKIDDHINKNTYEIKNNNDKTNQVAIIGMSGRFPMTEDVFQFWENIESGKECISYFTDEELLSEGISEEILNQTNYIKAKGVLSDLELFDASFFDYSPDEADKMDPQIRLFHEYVWKSLEDAGYAGDYDGSIGVFGGSASNYNWISQIFTPTTDIGERLEKIALNDKDYMSTRVSYKLNLRGPSYTVQTACSTSLAAIHLACNALKLGECDMAVAGGVSIMLPKKTGYFYEEGMMFSRDGHCKVFDKEASGTIFSDGIGVVVLKPLEDAIADQDHIYAVIKGSAVNNDGLRKVGYIAPSIEGQAEVIQKALCDAQVKPETISYLEAHGTGTILGDPIEIEGLKLAFDTARKNYCAIGSLKSNMGHLDAAAGVAGIIKTALALEHKKIPAAINYNTSNPDIDFEHSPFYLTDHTIDWNENYDLEGTVIPRRAGISSFGFGGTNVHVILEEAPPINKKLNLSRDNKLIVLSAKTKKSLEMITLKLSEFLLKYPDTDLDQLAFALQTGRKAFNHRKYIQVKNIQELLCSIDGKEVGHAYMNSIKPGTDRVVFMFTGQGSQYLNMAKELYDQEAFFKKEVDNCLHILSNIPNYITDLKKIWFASDDDKEISFLLDKTSNAQLLLFIIEYSLAKTLMYMGINPDVMIGHSLGEYVCACLAGVFTLSEGLYLVMHRSELMQQLSEGTMLSMRVSQEKAEQLIKDIKGLSLATVNSKDNCVV